MGISAERTIWDLFYDYKNKYSDKIPSKIIHSTNKDNQYKVRSAWFTGITTGAQMLLDQNKVADQNQRKRLEEFIQITTSGQFHQRGLTTKEQIDRGNEILDILISLRPKNE